MTTRKLVRLVLCTAILLGGICIPTDRLNAESITSVQSATVTLFSSQNLATQKCALNLDVRVWRSIALDVVYVPTSGAAATDIRMYCYGNNGIANNLNAQVITETDRFGVSTTVTSIWKHPIQVVGTGENWTWTFSNIIWPTISCCFTGTAANTHDIVTVYERNITP